MRRIAMALVFVFGLASVAWAGPSQVEVVPTKRIATYGRNTVTAGTEEALASDTPVTSCCVKALHGNTGNVYIGSGAGLTSSNGYVLDAGESLCVDIDSPADIWIDVDNSTEGVSYACVR